MKEKPIFKIEACCLICARGEPDDGTVSCTWDQCDGYLETHYCERFMLRDLGYDGALCEECRRIQPNLKLGVSDD